MITRFNKYVVLMLLLFSISGYCQNSSNSEIFINSSNLTRIDLVSNELTLVGNSYIDDQFLPGKISNQEKVYLMRYNAFKDIMEMELDGKPYYLPLSSNYTITFNSLNKIYQVLEYKEKEITKKGLFVVVFLGDETSLFLKEKIEFFEEVIAKTSYDKNVPPTLKRVDDKFFVVFKNNVAIALPNKKKDILSLFASKAAKIEFFVNENKLGFKNKEDLIQIFKYYDSLK